MTIKPVASTGLRDCDPEVFSAIRGEVLRENETLELIASENFVSQAVLEAAGGIMTNKYAEGYPGKRYYGGCEWVDEAENIARDRAKKLFNADYTNVRLTQVLRRTWLFFSHFFSLGTPSWVSIWPTEDI